MSALILVQFSGSQTELVLQCDEAKPTCARCVLGLDKCVYPTIVQPDGKSQSNNLHKPHLLASVLTPSPSSSPYSDRSFSASCSPHAASTCAESSHTTPSLNAWTGLSNNDLFQHYLHHTSLSLSLSETDYIVLHTTIPKLAQQNSIVYHALLAVSAAHLACNMISSQPHQDPLIVNKVLLAGYRHYNCASERMRVAMSRSEVDMDPLVASALLLVPFATSSQQINHWISTQTGGGVREAKKRLESTPRDVIVIMRGVRTLLQSTSCGSTSAHGECSPEPHVENAGLPTVLAVRSSFPNLAPSRTHFMTAIIATTSAVAFARLRQRLDAWYPARDQSDQGLAACSAAFEVLESIKSNGIGTSRFPPPPSTTPPSTSDSHELPPSLRSFAQDSFAFASTPPHPTHPLTRFFLTFLIRVPQFYLDLVLPLLDQRLESPLTFHTIPVTLTQTQALALDIYAHWSVLMFLVEKESWWIGTLPEVTLEGMLNRYGEGFVKRFWGRGRDEEEAEKWWPGWMLGVLKDAKAFS